MRVERALGGARPWVVVGCAVSVALVLINAIAPIHDTLLWDDAYIFFRYVDNLLAGHGLTWNPGGERVEGYSSFLYLMLLAIPRSWGAEFRTTAHVLNIGLYAVTVLLSVALMREALREWRPTVFLAPLLLAANSSMSVLSRSGMESMLFAALIVLALWLQARLERDSGIGQQLLSGFAFAAVALTRPEGAAVYGVCFAVTALGQRRQGNPLLLRHTWVQVLAFGVLVGAHLLFRLEYYGELLPNTVYAKAGLSSHQLVVGWGSLAKFLVTFRGALVGLALVGWAITPRCRVGDMLTAGLALWLVYLPSIGFNDWSLWYALPVDLFSSLGAGLALAKGWTSIDASNSSRLRRSIAALCFSLLLLGITGPKRYLAPPPAGQNMVEGFIRIGHSLRSLAEPGDTVAVGACGAIPYYSQLVVYDTLGLNDRHIAHLAPDEDGFFAHSKGDGRYILDKQPTFMVPFPGLTPQPHRGHSGLEKSFSEIFALPEFERDYEFRSLAVEGELFFNYYQRREGA